MTRFLVVDGVDIGALARLDTLELSSAAYGCDVGMGGFDWDDDVLDDVPAMKAAYLEETADSPARVWRGYVGQRTYQRGPKPKVDTERQLDVEMLDVNTLWDDPIMEGTDAKRPAETDYARMHWLATTSEMTSLGISIGVMPNTNTVNLDARDYRGEHPRLIAEECMEASKKNAFLYDHGSSGIQIYYDLATGTSLSSSAKLVAGVPADVNEAGLVFAMAEPVLRKDPARIYSKVRFNYASGHVTRTDAGTASSFRDRGITISDDTIKSSTKATNKADAYLDRASTEQKIFTTQARIPAESLNTVREGMRIQVKVPHLEIADWTWMRISRRTLLPQQQSGGSVGDRYTVALEFAEDLRPAGFGGRAGDGGASVDDGSAVTLTRYRLQEEIGGGPFGPAAGLWYTVDPDFAFGTYASPTTTEIELAPIHNVPWPYTDCGVSTGAVAGLGIQEGWYRFQADLTDDTLAGVRVTVADLSGTATGFAVGSGTLIVGVHTGASSSGAEVTAHGQWTEVGRVGSSGGTAFIPRSLLIDAGDGYCWIVIAPGWNISSGLLICNAAGNKPFGYVELGADSGGDAPVLVSATTVTASPATKGSSPWLPADGDVDGSNTTYELPLWNGDGVPDVRVGASELVAGEFSYDGDASPPTVTLLEAPPDYMAGQVYYRPPGS